MDYKELRRKIETFSLDDGDLGSQGYERVLIQLFGLTGHGKSSFINSCKYALSDGGEFIEYAESGHKDDGGSVTMERKAYELINNITMVDNRGCNKITDFERAEVYTQLGNFSPLNGPVVWKENFKDATSVLYSDDNTTDLLVPIFIYSASHNLPPQEADDVKALLENCDMLTGVVPIVVLTNKTKGDVFELEKMFKRMGAETVITIENYTSANNRKTLGRTTDILSVIGKALDNVLFRLSLPRDPVRDQRERRKFLHNYIHEAELKAEREKCKKEEESQKNQNKEAGFFQRLRQRLIALLS